MAKEKLEDLSIEQLKKKKKSVSIFMGICIGIVILNIVVLVFSLVKGSLENIATLVPGFVLVFFIIVMFAGVKKIDEELAKRNDK
jgi:hypothetical protein